MNWLNGFKLKDLARTNLVIVSVTAVERGQRDTMV